MSELHLIRPDELPFSDPFTCPVCHVEKTVADFPTPDACRGCDHAAFGADCGGDNTCDPPCEGCSK